MIIPKFLATLLLGFILMTSHLSISGLNPFDKSNTVHTGQNLPINELSCFLDKHISHGGQADKIHTVADPSVYLNDIKTELLKRWPDNRTVNLVFHGHSVPAGYFVTPVVNTLDSYPYQLLKLLKEIYPYAVINIINTSIGGENSEKGAGRFVSDVLTHNPDILFIDYALNDRGIGLDRSKENWEKMVSQALDLNIKVFLLTPSPDQRVDLLDTNSILDQHARQIKTIAGNYGVGLIDSYELFRQKVRSGDELRSYMSQVNHPNKEGHFLIANEIMNYFK